MPMKIAKIDSSLFLKFLGTYQKARSMSFVAGIKSEELEIAVTLRAVLNWAFVIGRYEKRYGKGGDSLKRLWKKSCMQKKPGRLRDERRKRKRAHEKTCD